MVGFALTALLALACQSTEDRSSGIQRAGDIDGDGVPDWLVSDPEAPVVWAVSGRDGSGLLRLFREGDERFGVAIASAGDLDRDGRADVIVGSGDAWQHLAGEVRVFSGADGEERLHLRSPRNDPTFGLAVAGGADVDGDGVPDLAVGEPSRRRGQPEAFTGGRAYVYSGKSGELLGMFESEPQGTDAHVYYGASVSLVPDADGDGLADLLVGAPIEWDSPGWGPATESRVVDPSRFDAGFPGRRGPLRYQADQWTGYAEVVNVASGKVHQRFESFPSDRYGFGECVSPAGDTDGDGVADYIITSRHSNAWLFSGRTAQALYAAQYGGGLSGQARTAEGLGDIDGDALGDFVVGCKDVPGMGARAPFVEVHSGGKRKRLWWKRLAGSGGVDVCALGDVNGDGVPDFAYFEIWKYAITIVSGADFEPLRRVRLPELQRQWEVRIMGAAADRDGLRR